MGKITKRCSMCDKKFEVYASNAHRYSNCSKECTRLARKGELNSNFRHGNRKLAHRYHGMKERCSNKKHSSYKCYGGKGVKCLITQEEFIKWFEENCNGDYSLQVDRIDNNGHYELRNIQLLPQSKNVAKSNKESPRAYNKYKERRRMSVKINGVVYDSLNQAEKALKMRIKDKVKNNEPMSDGTKIEIVKE